MGCDIHSFAEVRKNNKWEFLKKGVFPNPYRDGETTNIPVYARNYDLFAILANVRNGYGFAGVKTGEGFVPIAQPKGLPSDVSSEVYLESERWDGDGHSHSWLTVQELIDYDWSQFTMKKGVVPYKEYEAIKAEDRQPHTYSGGVSGRDVVTIDEAEAEQLLTGTDIPRLAGKSIYVNYHWMIRYSDHAQYFLNTTLPILKTLGEPQDVRIVFFFDN